MKITDEELQACIAPARPDGEVLSGRKNDVDAIMRLWFNLRRRHPDEDERKNIVARRTYKGVLPEERLQSAGGIAHELTQPWVTKEGVVMEEAPIQRDIDKFNAWREFVFQVIADYEQ